MREFEGCDCMELGAQICDAYEAWCSEVQAEEDWNAMSQVEKDEIHTWNAAWVLAGPYGVFTGLLAPEVEF